MKAVKSVVQGLVDFIQSSGHKKLEVPPAPNSRYKTSMCRDYQQRGTCPRGINCTFAHSQDELERYLLKLYILHFFIKKKKKIWCMLD